MRAISYIECSTFVKEKLKINLFPYQEDMLRAFCEGKEVRTARCIGRTFVAECFGQYVAHLYDKNDFTKEPDVVFPYMVAEPYHIPEKFVENMKKMMSEDDFNRTVLCK